MAPGQTHAVATLSRDTEELTGGAIMYGSQFLSARCMLSSLLSSWTDRISQRGALSEFAWSETITTCLVAMVSRACVQLGQPQVHGATPRDIISLSCMALLFIQEKRDPDAYHAAQWLRDTYAATHPEDFKDVQCRFRELKVANLQMRPSSRGELKRLRGRMREAIRSLQGK